ncbi:hypothetical protein [Tessaracoccus flavus]|jgi:hypothetical protein|uniref:Uncharacterized protein n=1 Tax=Tessaracoccus flavus TaxID=1610493 RepID=A0A1Q2CDW0_9ACTN|nr:hypothetical protein [Tessaracoccus flavus]AQP44312.1 hypothetical protein RPIT_05375 [Tessaracoccus flavus]SDY65615.1 hypothetical protein SAMN05428934_10322 [Tessaracoccus flavus]
MKHVFRLVVILLVGLLAACSAPSAEPQTVELVVTDPPAPTVRVEVPLGAEVTLRITSAIDDRAHLHGYEIEQDLEAGVPTDIVFDATMSGTYELESHVTDAIWADLVVK